MRRLDEIRAHRVVIAVAGMEGALFSVLAGLIDAPVIAVPASVGYGVSVGGDGGSSLGSRVLRARRPDRQIQRLRRGGCSGKDGQ